VLLLIAIIILYGMDIYQQCYVNLEQEYFIFMNYSESHRLVELGKKYHYGSDHIKQDYKKANELYNLAVKNGDYIAYIYKGILHLDMHEIDMAITYFNQAIDKGFFQCFINLGDVYFYEKEYVDLELAEDYYKAAIKYSTSAAYKVIAKDKLDTLRLEKNDMYYNNEPEVMDIDTMMKYDMEDIDEIVQKQTPVPGYNELLNGTPDTTHMELEVRKNDPQNVHDHVVSNTVRRSIENLIKHTEIMNDLSQTLIDIRKFIKEQDAHQDIALQVLDHIEIDNTCFRDMKLKQVDLLNLVWNRIHNKCNEAVIDILKKNLYNRILECHEYDSKVCASGIFSRLIDTLNYCDGDKIVQIIPKYVLNKELMGKASIVSKLFLAEQPKRTRELLIEYKLTSDEQKIVNDYNERLKQKLISEFRKDYIDTNIISEDILFLEINKWINYI